MSDSDLPVNGKKLFVGNLPYHTTEDQLTEIFGQFGELTSVKLVTDRMTGRSRGIAFVEFASEEMAAQAIEGLHGTELDSRALVVNVARPQAPRENRGFGGPRSGGSGGFRGGNDRRGGGGFRSRQ